MNDYVFHIYLDTKIHKDGTLPDTTLLDTFADRDIAIHWLKKNAKTVHENKWKYVLVKRGNMPDDEHWYMYDDDKQKYVDFPKWMQ